MIRINIMIIEDDEIVLEDIKEMLTGLGYNIVATFSSGEQVLKEIQKINPDIILMDITLLGEMDGIETAEKINEIKDIPIIFITGAESNKKVLQNKVLEKTYGFISKPVEEKELHATIEIALHKYQMKKKYRIQYKNIPIPTYTWKKVDDEFILVDYNEVVEKYKPSIKDDLLGTNIKDYYKNSSSNIIDSVNLSYNQKMNFKEELDFDPPNSSKKIKIRNYLVSYSFTPPNLVTVHKEDITLIKQMEKELKQKTDTKETEYENDEIYIDSIESTKPFDSTEIIISGLPISGGIALGRAYILKHTTNDKKESIPKYIIKDKDMTKEILRLNKAINETKEQLKELEKTTLDEIGESESKIFHAMRMIIEDSEFLDKIRKGIKYNKQNAESVVKSVIDYYLYKFSNIKNNYIRERSHDIEELGSRIIANLIKHKKSFNDLLGMDSYSLNNKNYIVIANKLTPQLTSSLNKKFMAGIVTEHGSYSSHAGILARGMSLPAVSGIKSVLKKVNINSEVLIDGYKGIVIINPNEKTKKNYKNKLHTAESNPIVESIKNNIVKTKDGVEIELLSNISNLDDFELIEHTKHNIGLYRTEFLFINSTKKPTEEQQFNYYYSIAKKLDKTRYAIFRTLDIGYDKVPSYFPSENTENPALGLRGIRFSLYHKDLFTAQIRALLKVSHYGNIKIMFPMINSVKEVIDAKTIIEKEKHKLKLMDIPVAEKIECGIMVETPASLLSLEHFVGYIDFLSIGTNDLIQYLLAIDRNNENVSEYYNHYHPSIVRSLKIIHNFSKKYNIPASLCGELNTDLNFLPYLIGLGFRKFSINPILNNLISRAIEELDVEQCKNKVESQYNLNIDY